MTRNIRIIPLAVLAVLLPWSLHVQAERDLFSSQNEVWQKMFAHAKVVRYVPVDVIEPKKSGVLPDQWGNRSKMWIARHDLPQKENP